MTTWNVSLEESGVNVLCDTDLNKISWSCVHMLLQQFTLGIWQSDRYFPVKLKSHSEPYPLRIFIIIGLIIFSHRQQTSIQFWWWQIRKKIVLQRKKSSI